MDIRLLEVSGLCKSDSMIRSGVKMTLVKMKANLYSSDLIDVFYHAVTSYAFREVLTCSVHALRGTRGTQELPSQIKESKQKACCKDVYKNVQDCKAGMLMQPTLNSQRGDIAGWEGQPEIHEGY